MIFYLIKHLADRKESELHTIFYVNNNIGAIH